MRSTTPRETALGYKKKQNKEAMESKSVIGILSCSLF